MWARTAVGMVALACSLVGCMDVETTTYLARDIDFPAPGDTVTIGVIAEADPDEPLLEAEVKHKIELLLQDNGYETRDPSQAAFVLLTFFSIDSGTDRLTYRTRYRPGGQSTSYVQTNTGQSAIVTTNHPGTTEHIPKTETIYRRFLTMRLFDRVRWTESTQVDGADAVIWTATTHSTGKSSDLRVMVDGMLLTTFKYFGQDTGERKRRRIPIDNSDAKDLRKRASSRPA